MADSVQYELESMLPELEEMLQLELFTDAEIKMIVKKRTNFEYLLKRKKPEKADFLSYIDYEITLGDMKRKRIKRKKPKAAQIQCVHVTAQRVHRIYNRAKQRWPNDVKIWDSHHIYCKKEGSWKILSTSYASAIQLHPRDAHFWEEAAMWEYTKNNNVDYARALYQRALRISPHNRDLWLSYFKMELLYLKDMRTSSSQLVADTENAVKVGSLPDEEDAPKDVVQTDSSSSPFMAGVIPKIVFKSAIKNIPDDLELRLSFIREYEFNLLSDLVENINEIYASLANDFPQNREVLSLLARKQDSPQKSFEVYEQALSISSDSANIYDAYVEYCLTTLKTCPKDKQSVYLNKLNKLFVEIESKQSLNPSIIQQYISLYLNEAKLTEALALADKGTKLFSCDSSLWILSIKLTLDIKKSATNTSAIVDMFVKALKNNLDNKLNVYSNLLEFLVLYRFEWDTIVSHYKRAIAVLGSESDRLRTAFIERIFLTYGIEKTRDLYKCTLDLPPNTLEVCLKCIQIEKSQPSIDHKRVKDLYEHAVYHFGKEEDGVWLDYIAWVLQNEGPTQISAIYWRAKHSLSNPTNFITNYVKLNNTV